MRADHSDLPEIGVSVIMPGFNAEKTIRASILSVLSQTHRKLELIVINDHSEDDTGLIAKAIAEEDARVRVLENACNLGVSAARNIGVRSAQYDWIALLDSDDLWKTDKLEKQLCALADDGRASICFTGSAFMDMEDKIFGYELSVPERISYDELVKQNLISCSSVLIRKQLLEMNPMHSDPMIHEDFATWLKIMKDEPYALGINEPLLIYRIQSGSKSGNKLRAARMQWRTYRYVGISRSEAVRYLISYAKRNVKKYKAILGSTRSEKQYE